VTDEGTSSCCSQQEFFKSHPAPAAERTIQQSLENIRLNADQLKRDGELIKGFLSAFQ
jgi:puromycin-sensitive aminopeptidase